MVLRTGVFSNQGLLENSAKLDGAEKITSSTAKCCYSDQNVKLAQSKEVPMEKEPGTASLQQRPKKGLSISDIPVKSSGNKDKKRFEEDELKATNLKFANLDGVDAVESKNLLSSSSNEKTACTLNIQEAPATPAEAPCPLIIQEAPATPAEAPGTLNLQEAPTISAEAPCTLISEKAPANPAEAPHSLSHQETPTYQAEVPDTFNCLKTKDSIIRIPPAGSKEKAIPTFLFFPSGRPAASLETLNSFLSQLQQTNFSSSGNLSSSPEIQEASKENPQEAAAFVNSTNVESNQEIIPKFRSPCSQATILPEFNTQQNSMKRKRLEPVKTAPKRISRLQRIEEHLINQSLFSYSLTQAIEEDSSTPQSVWDPGGKLPKRVSKLSIGIKWNGQLTESGASHPSSTAFSDLQSNGYQVDQDVEPIERALLGSVLGIYCIPTVIDIIATGPQQRAPILLSLPTQSIVPYPTQPQTNY
ncbi:hypothetical protein DAPPUDRAFT_252593 [Daphnia pulex]|uniref:Uncharacterized protein n=1 Tax=Daphnia pulex TaxID=6669 RepID=E9H329_DAPPU|nr:hypothetical protein DAPPUDRAFT_252593 [Daphnia pulex]|eukprot:EFX73908.1 hypothetical protein DAPPUDRAFT_252593 [Daphnia pulex]